MKVKELIRILIDMDDNKDVYVTTKDNLSAEILEVEEVLYPGHGKYRGVYIVTDEDTY